MVSASSRWERSVSIGKRKAVAVNKLKPARPGPRGLPASRVPRITMERQANASVGIRGGHADAAGDVRGETATVRHPALTVELSPGIASTGIHRRPLHRLVYRLDLLASRCVPARCAAWRPLGAVAYPAFGWRCGRRCSFGVLAAGWVFLGPGIELTVDGLLDDAEQIPSGIVDAMTLLQGSVRPIRPAPPGAAPRQPAAAPPLAPACSAFSAGSAQAIAGSPKACARYCTYFI